MKKIVLSVILCCCMFVSVFSFSSIWSDAAPAFAVSANAAVTKSKIEVRAVKPKVTLSKTSCIWNGKEKRPAVTVSVGKKILNKKDYVVAYKNNIDAGIATVKVSLKNQYKGSATKSFIIRPKGTVLTGLSGRAPEKIAVKWKIQNEKMSRSRISGYMLQYAQDSSFSKGCRSIRINDYKTTSKTISGLKENTKYYVRIRTFKTIKDKRYYSAWSGTRSVKTAKNNNQKNEDILQINGNDIALADALYKNGVKNAVTSPVSIHSAMAMLLEGANAQTKEELESFLGVKKEELESWMKNMKSATLNEEKTKTILSNAFWYKKEQQVQPGYIATLKNRYGAEVSDLDFHNADHAAAVINGWCNEKTNGLIPSIVTPDLVRDKADVLLNTVYFKASWQEPFENFSVSKEVFHGFEKDKTVEFLHSSERTYYENDAAIAFRKPYNKKYSFIGILPKKEGEFNLADLDIQSLISSKVTKYNTVRAIMPKLSIDSGGNITEILKALGVVNAFSNNADLTGIADDLAVSDVIHKTKIILDEKGTEAAAATAIVVKDSSAPTPGKVVEVRLDRPYAFLIMDDATGQVLFMGKITEP